MTDYVHTKPIVSLIKNEDESYTVKRTVFVPIKIIGDEFINKMKVENIFTGGLYECSIIIDMLEKGIDVQTKVFASN